MVGKVAESVCDAVDSVQRSETGRFLTDLADQVAETVSSVAGAGDKTQEAEVREFDLDAAGVTRLHAETSNGGVDLKGTDVDRVRVRARIEVRAPDETSAREFCATVEVHAERAGDEIRVWRQHPKPPRGFRVAVSYEIECPARLPAVVRTLNGKLGVEGTAVEVDAETANGHVELRAVQGRILARTKNGTVQAHVDTLAGESQFNTLNGRVQVEVVAGQALVQAKTLNGSVEVILPRDFDGQLDARTTNGRVRSDFPIAMTGEARKNQLQGPIGRGGSDLVDLRTVNGSVTLKTPTCS